MRDEDIVAAARQLQADLPELAGQNGGALSRTLGSLLGRAAAGEQVADAILNLLVEDAVTREELRRRLPEEDNTQRSIGSEQSYSGLPGYSEPAMEIIYGCGTCGYEYPIFEIGEAIPASCPRGHGPLVRADWRM